MVRKKDSIKRIGFFCQRLIIDKDGHTSSQLHDDLKKIHFYFFGNYKNHCFLPLFYKYLKIKKYLSYFD